jgi:asparagine synthase (glutamine-hydrolysing)
MCGIAGIIGNTDHREQQLLAMLDAQKHRGPDHQGTFLDQHVALGHNRLSIIDLSEVANQPFFSNDGKLILVFNGEIYNYLEIRDELSKSYIFKTQSDTEVLIAAYQVWGKACLSKFNGMFSFVIWDMEKQELFAARDRFGVKPFYYTIKNNCFYFASEIKTLFAAGVTKTPNDQIWADYFCHGSYGMPDETFWKDIHQLPGSHALTYKNDVLEIEQWYDFVVAIQSHKVKYTFEEAKSKYEELLKDSIQLRFRADVPVGFNLSGGLDSSALLALVNTIDQGKNIKAFTFYTGDDRYDELPWVEQLIATTNNPLEKVLLNATEVPVLSKKMAEMQDEPYGGVPTVAYGKLFQEARTQGVTVLLDGQGMDEQWAGYDYYTNKSNSTIQGVSKSPFKKEVLSDAMISLSRKRNYPKPFNDEVLNLQYRDIFYTKIPRALRFNDRVSMAASTELREPFLDYRLVEFGFSQPLAYKVRDGIQKFLVRDLMKSYMSDSVSLAPKRPLQTPQREWLAEDVKDWTIDRVEQLKATSWFKDIELDKELDNYMKGDRDSSFHIWQWINASLLI